MESGRNNANGNHKVGNVNVHSNRNTRRVSVGGFLPPSYKERKTKWK